MPKPRLTLAEHADLLRLVLALETAHRGIAAGTLHALPSGSPTVRAWRRMDKALCVLKSAMEDQLYADHPQAAAAAGSPHYGNEPGRPSAAAARFLWRHGNGPWPGLGPSDG